MLCYPPKVMDFTDTAVDRIHYLVDRAQELMDLGMNDEALILMQQAGEIAKVVREKSSTPAKTH